MDLTETQIASEPIYEGTFVTIARDTVRLSNGNQSSRIVIRHPGAACILATTSKNEVVFVRQWRYATEQALLELPAGKLEYGEDPAECALRELAEETPYTAENVRLVQTFYTAPGFCNEKMFLYFAENVQPNSQLKPDTDELLETVLMTRNEIIQAIENNEIQDAKTLIGLQYWLLHS